MGLRVQGFGLSLLATGLGEAAKPPNLSLAPLSHNAVAF